MAANLRFDIEANDDASAAFAELAAQARAAREELARLDGMRVRPRVQIQGASPADLARIRQAADALRDLDGRNARARVQIDGAIDPAQVRQLRATAKALRELDGLNAQAGVAFTGNLPDPKDLRATARALRQLQEIGTVFIRVEVTGAADELAAIIALGRALRNLPDEQRTRVSTDVDKGLLERVKGLGSGLKDAAGHAASLAKGLGLLGAASGAVQTLAGVAAAAQQLAPAALILPGVLLGVAAAYGAVKLASSGVADALSGDAEAMAKLAPSARSAVAAIREFAPAWDAIQQRVQGAVFDGLDKQLTNIGRTVLPVLSDGLTDIGRQLNVVAKGALAAAETPFFTDDVAQILSNTAGMLREVGTGVGDVLSGFVGLGAVGSQYLPALGEAIGGVAARFEQWVNEGVESGRIEAMIDRALQGFSDLFAILGDIAAISGTVWDGLSGGGAAEPLANLRELTGALREFFASAQAQGPLQALGETMRVVGGVVKDVLLTGLREIAPIVEPLAPIFQTLARVVGDVLTNAFEVLGPKVRNLVEKLGPVADQALPAIGAVINNVVIPAIGAFIDGLAAGVEQAGRFAVATIAAFTGFSSAVAGAVSGILGVLEGLFRGLAVIPGLGEQFGRAADGVAKARGEVDGFKTSMDQIHDKAVSVMARVENGEQITDIAAELLGLPPRTRVVVDAETDPFTGKLTSAITTADGSVATVTLEGDPTQFNGKTQQAIRLADGSRAIITIDGDPDPATGKADATIQYANGKTAKIQIDAETQKAFDNVTAVVAFGDGSTAKIKLDGEPSLVNGKIQQAVTFADGSTGKITIDGNPDPATGKVNATVEYGNGRTAVVTIDGDNAPAIAKTNAAVTFADGSSGTVDILGDNTDATGKTTLAVRFADGSTGTIRIDGNPDPATGKVNGTVTYANGRTGTIKVDANAAAANSAINNAARPRTTTITVNTVYNSVPTATGTKRIAGQASGGMVAGYSGGGIRGPLHFGGGGYVVPGYAPGVDDQLAMVSRGESVLVPELTRALGASRIMAANREASGGRPGTVTGSIASIMDGAIGRRMSSAAGPRGSVSAGPSGTGALVALGALAGRIDALGIRIDGLGDRLARVIGSARPITVEDRSGNPAETARATALRLRA